MSAGRSWFYLTLWNGSPSGMTEYVDATLDVQARRQSDICVTEPAAQAVETVSKSTANVDHTTAAGVEIITTTEVVWYVGRVQS